MPLLDTTDALDPLNLDTFTFSQTTQVVGSDGIAVRTTSDPIAACGVVTPVKPTSLRRLDDGTRLDAAIDIITRYPLTSGYKKDDETSYEASVVWWEGRAWVVAMLAPFSAFGAGFVHAQCDLLQQMPTSKEPQRSP
jgi:hypothetical protein